MKEKWLYIVLFLYLESPLFTISYPDIKICSFLSFLNWAKLKNKIGDSKKNLWVPQIPFSESTTVYKINESTNVAYTILNIHTVQSACSAGQLSWTKKVFSSSSFNIH